MTPEPATEAEIGLIAACLAPYWDADWGLVEVKVLARGYDLAGGVLDFNVPDELMLRRLLHILEKHRDDYPFEVTFSHSRHDLGGEAQLWFPTREAPHFSLELHGHGAHDWAAEMQGRFGDFHPAFG